MKLQLVAGAADGRAFVHSGDAGGAELDPEWRQALGEFDPVPPAAASRPARQGHARSAPGGRAPRCKLNIIIPTWPQTWRRSPSSRSLLINIGGCFRGAAIDTARLRRRSPAGLREELDLHREAKLARLYKMMLTDRRGARASGSSRTSPRRGF